MDEPGKNWCYVGKKRKGGSVFLNVRIGFKGEKQVN